MNVFLLVLICLPFLPTNTEDFCQYYNKNDKKIDFAFGNEELFGSQFWFIGIDLHLWILQNQGNDNKFSDVHLNQHNSTKSQWIGNTYEMAFVIRYFIPIDDQERYLIGLKQRDIKAVEWGRVLPEPVVNDWMSCTQSLISFNRSNLAISQIPLPNDFNPTIGSTVDIMKKIVVFIAQAFDGQVYKRNSRFIEFSDYGNPKEVTQISGTLSLVKKDLSDLPQTQRLVAMLGPFADNIFLYLFGVDSKVMFCFTPTAQSCSEANLKLVIQCNTSAISDDTMTSGPQVTDTSDTSDTSDVSDTSDTSKPEEKSNLLLIIIIIIVLILIIAVIAGVIVLYRKSSTPVSPTTKPESKPGSPEGIKGVPVKRVSSKELNESPAVRSNVS